MASLGSRIARAFARIVTPTRRRRPEAQLDGALPSPPTTGTPLPRSEYAGDFEGTPRLDYSPVADDRPDPGEVVWAWVPYEEDHSKGKDRPVLVVGRHGGLLLALPLTSKDHDRDAAQEASVGRHWCDIGSGGWDARGRPSEVRVDRILQLDPTAVRRIGAVLARDRFEDVVAAVRAHRG